MLSPECIDFVQNEFKEAIKVEVEIAFKREIKKYIQMTIEGLNSNFYYTNNPIFITIKVYPHQPKYIQYFAQGSGCKSYKIVC